MDNAFRFLIGLALAVLSSLVVTGITKGEPGDLNNDHEINLLDLEILNGCIAGPASGTVASECLSADINASGTVDIIDFGEFQRRFGFGQGPPRITSMTPTPGTFVVDDQGLGEIKLGFSEPVAVPSDAVMVWTVSTGLVTDFTTIYDDLTRTLTVAFEATTPSPLRDDRVTIVVDYTITDLSGDQLDGEIVDPANALLPSGDGIRGGQAVFRINVLQGDANRDGLVDATDEAAVLASLGLCNGDAGFDPDSDLNGNGCVDPTDQAIATAALGRALPLTDGAAPDIASRTPAIDARVRDFNVSTVDVTLSEALRSELVTASSLFVIRPDGSLQPSATVALTPNNTTATFIFTPPLPAADNYQFNLSNALADASGELLAVTSQKQWSVFIDASPTTIIKTSPSSAEGMVALTRETIITFRDTIQPNQVLTPGDIKAEFAGQALGMTQNSPRITPDGKHVKLFYDPPLPPASRIRVTLNGDNLVDDLGNVLDADGDGVPGGTRTIDFDTCTTACIPNTTVFGFMFESKLRGPMGEDLPLVGATLCVEGIPDLCTVTDATGRFELGGAPSQGCPLGGVPAPEFIVHIDGKTVTAVGGDPFDRTTNGGFYPTITKTFRSNPGHTVQIMQDNAPFDIYLPFVADEALQAVNPTQMTEVGLTPEGATRFCELFPDECAANPNTADALTLMIPPGSFNNDDGSPGNMAGIFPIDSTRLPAPLPGGQVHAMDITIQSDGATNFDLPTPICFPNVPDPATNEALRPGEETGLVSFNHDKGKWEFRGLMVAGPDDNGDGFAELVCPREGVGVAAPGWHGTAPPPGGPPPPPPCMSGCCEPHCGCMPPDCCCDPLPCCPNSDKCKDLAGLGLCTTQASMGLADCKAKCGYVQSGCSLACRFVPGGLAKATCLGVCFDIAKVCEAVCLCKTNSKLCDCQRRFACGGECGFLCGIGGSDNLAASAAGSGNTTIDALESLEDQMFALIAPFAESGQNIPDQVLNDVFAIRDEMDVVAGGDANTFFKDFILQTTEAELLPLVGQVRDPGHSPDRGVFYLAAIAKPSGTLLVRGMTGPNAQYSIFAPRDGTLLLVSFYDPVERSFGTVFPIITPGQPFIFPRAFLLGIDGSFTDVDGDGLADVAETVIGTTVSNADTDGDGISDGAELNAGTDPLDGLPAATGILASADTPGNAVDVCAVNNVAIVADSNSGVTVFNVTAGPAPVAVAQIDTPGNAQAVSCTGNLIAVADGTAGLTIIDVTDPPAARVARGIPLRGGSAQAIASAGDLVLVGSTGGVVSMVRIDTGVVLDTIDLGGTVQDLAIEGERLYAYANGQLQTLSFLRGPLTLLGSVGSPGTPLGRGRIFVGGDVVYLVKATGFNTFDVSDPASPLVIASGTSGQRGWQDIATTGSGTGVAVVSPFGLNTNSNVSLFDTTDPSVTTLDDTFLTTFPTPGVARAVTLFNGQAFIADGESGLQVVNYKAFDTGSVPPTAVALTASIDASTAIEGRPFTIRARVTDDVQVRDVEFFLDGLSIGSDGGFPFGLATRIPVGRGGTDITLTAIASDTGGNSTPLGPIVIPVQADIEPPAITIDSPQDMAVFNVFDSMSLRVPVKDNADVAEIDILIDGSPATLYPVTFAEFAVDVPGTLGTHTLSVTARDPSGLTSTVDQTFEVRVETVSRAVSVYGEEFLAVQIRDAVSREISVYNLSGNVLVGSDAQSREVSVFQGP